MNRPLVMLHGIHLNGYDGSLDGFYAGGFKWAAKNGWGGSSEFQANLRTLLWPRRSA
jgi:hypothetical protein